MKRRLLLCLLVVGSSLLFGISAGQAVDTWSGACSFSLKATSEERDNSGNDKFLTSTQSFSGTLSFYVLDNTLVTNADGCYLAFNGTDGTSICIKDVAVISTETFKSKSEKTLVVGWGDFSTRVEGNLVNGLAYVDLQGTAKQDSNNKVISLALKGKLGGGADSNFVFNATLNNTTLTKE